MRPWLVALLVAVPATAAQPTKRPTDAERGRELYERHCAACHGAGNRGDGAATAALVFPVPDLVGKIKSDRERITLVQQGRGPMPGFQATFDEADTKRVLGHMSKLDGSAPAAAAPDGAVPPPDGAVAPPDGAAPPEAEAPADPPGGDVGEGPG